MRLPSPLHQIPKVVGKPDVVAPVRLVWSFAVEHSHKNCDIVLNVRERYLGSENLCSVSTHHRR
jgi:hypothetical protein